MAGACQGQPELRAKLDRLLSAHLHAGSFLESPAEFVGTSEDLVAGWMSNDEISIDERIGGSSIPVQVGPYVLKEKIGEGGFGLVFLAEQEEPVRRDVAVKLIKAGMDTAEVLSRFNIERQALAMMDHPNIARILDAGQAENGRPYFVMEVVEGTPITEYCDQNKLSIRDRLELFVSVCNAVQHAHQKGVIHRDLKPSNILVSELQEAPVPKVIDFGVAKALEQRITGDSIQTVGGQLIGTPLYMSPEQASRKNQDVDVRIDVYSLGILLFELLTGNTPITRQFFANAEMDDVLKMIRENDTPRPSFQVGKHREQLDDIARNRQTTSSRLERLIQGDLDWIVAKATRKDLNGRYESVVGFGRDVERYLSSEPIEARPPSAVYRVGKFIRKNRAATITSLMFAVLLIAATSVSGWLAYHATQNQLAAEKALKAEELAKAELKKTLESKAESLRAYQAIHSAFKIALNSPKHSVNGADYKVYDMLNDNMNSVMAELVDHPKTKSELLTTFAGTCDELGFYSDSTRLFQNALELLVSMDGVGPDQIVQAELNLAENYYKNSLYDRAVLVLDRAEKRLSEDTERFPELKVSILIQRAEIDRARARYPLALGILKEAYAVAESKLATMAPLRIEALRSLGVAYDDVGDFANAVKLKKKLIALGENAAQFSDLDQVNDSLSMAVSLAGEGKRAEALQRMEPGVEKLRTLVGQTHPDLGRILAHNAILLLQSNRYEEAVAEYRKAMRIVGKTVAVGELVAMDRSFQSTLRSVEDPMKAGELYQEAVESLCEPDPAPDEYFVRMACIVGMHLSMGGKYERAIELMDEAMVRAERSIGFDNAVGGMCLYMTGRIYSDARRYEKAKSLFQRVLSQMDDADWADHRVVLTAKFHCGRMCLLTGDPQNAITPLREALKTMQDSENSPALLSRRIDIATLLAIANWQNGDPEDAVDVLKQLKQRNSLEGESHLQLLGRVSDLFKQYQCWEGAVHFLRESRELVAERHPASLRLARGQLVLGNALLEFAVESPEADELAKEAEVEFLQAYEITTELANSGGDSTVKKEQVAAVQGLIWVYEMTAQSGKQKEWESRLERLQTRETDDAEESALRDQ